MAAPGDVRPKIGAERHLFALKRRIGTLLTAKTATSRTNFHQKPAQSRVLCKTCCETEVVMDASTYGRLVERGGYATGGIVREPVWPTPDGGGCTVLIHPRLSAIEIDIDRSVSPEAARRYSEGLVSQGWRVSIFHRAPGNVPDPYMLLLECRR